MNGEGSIELNSWFMSRSFSFMVRGRPWPLVATPGKEERVPKSSLSSALLVSSGDGEVGSSSFFRGDVSLETPCFVSASECDDMTKLPTVF
jgi:hypothetical protein